MALKNFQTETTAAALPKPSLPINEGIKANTLIVKFDSGYEQTRKKGDSFRTFEFSYQALTATQAQAIEDFYLEHLNYKPFYWTHPTTYVTYKVRFDMDTFQKEMFVHSIYHGPIYKLAIKLLQVYPNANDSV